MPPPYAPLPRREKRKANPATRFPFLYAFSLSKKNCEGLCLGPGAWMERAGSIGRASLSPRRSRRLSVGGGGRSFPRPPPGETSALWFQAGHPGPRALEPLGPYAPPLSKDRECSLFYISARIPSRLRLNSWNRSLRSVCSTHPFASILFRWFLTLTIWDSISSRISPQSMGGAAFSG
jgi:hypothetical protein